MSEPTTEPIETDNLLPTAETKPVRELSQAAIAAFFYGTLQLLLTMVGSVMVVILDQTMKAFKSSTGTDLSGLTGTGGTDTGDLAEMQKMIEELGITDDPSYVIPVPNPSIGPTPDVSTPDMPVAVPDVSTMPNFVPESTPSQIVTSELFIILITHGFGLLGLITAFIAFNAAAKGKSGRGLAITGLVSSFFSFVIAFMVALTV